MHLRCGFSGSRHPDLLGKYPLYADIFPLIIGAGPSNCWLLLGLPLEPLPASLYHPVSRSFTARYTVGETMFGLTSILSLTNVTKPLRVLVTSPSPFGAVNSPGDAGLSFRLPSEPDLCFDLYS